MTHCVYYAYVSHLNHLGLTPNRRDLWLYETIKRLTHGSIEVPTFAGVVPVMYGAMARGHGLRMIVGCHPWITPDALCRETSDWRQKLCTRLWRPDFYTEGTGSLPAIYLLESQHAIFNERMPDEIVWVAIRLYWYPYRKGGKI